MGNHPSVSLKLDFQEPITPEEAYSRITDNIPKGFKVSEKYDKRHILTTTYTTSIGWKDTVSIKVGEDDGQTYVEGTSRSTNILPFWCFCFRSCCECWGLFSDGGQNSYHIRELVDKVGIDVEEELVQKTGLLTKYKAPKRSKKVKKEKVVTSISSSTSENESSEYEIESSEEKKSSSMNGKYSSGYQMSSSDVEII